MRRTILPRNITLVFVLALFAVFWATNGSFATGRTYEIYTVTDLKNAAQQSRIAGYEDDTYVLMNDITITAEDQRIIDNSDTKYITFGSSDLPFSQKEAGSSNKVTMNHPIHRSIGQTQSRSFTGLPGNLSCVSGWI